MKRLMIVLALLFANGVHAQKRPILDVLYDQADAFNKGDIERLVKNVSDDFIWFSLTSDTLMIDVSGKQNFRTSMINYFAGGRKVHSSIEQYAIDGNRVSFREVVSHKGKDGQDVSASAIGIYEIVDGRIRRAWYFID